MKNTLLFPILLALSITSLSCANDNTTPEFNTTECTIDTCSEDGKLIRCEKRKKVQPTTCPENQSCYISRCIYNTTLKCKKEGCSLEEYIATLNNIVQKNEPNAFNEVQSLAKQGLLDYPNSAEIRCQQLTAFKNKAINPSESIKSKCAFKKEYEKLQLFFTDKPESLDNPEHLKNCLNRIKSSSSFLDLQCP